MVSTAIVHGIASVAVSVEADVSDGMPIFEMVGFLASEVKEARERVRTALRNSGYILPAKRITINLSPADVRKSGSGFDLPIAVAILTALGLVDEERLPKMIIVGEVGLNGNIQPVSGILPIVCESRKRGFHSCMVPSGNVNEAELVKEMNVIGVSNLQEVIYFLNVGNVPKQRPTENMIVKNMPEKELDFAEINGQKFLKRACEVSVSGMHNLLMVGPPGSGKTMAAKRIPSILPPMQEEEKMELSKIYSVSGMFDQQKGLLDQRPFRCPHHTVTPQGLAGGGQYPKPGEISLAHSGVLFLDELPEFQRNSLEILRQPLEDKEVRLVRLAGNYCYPADFLLVAAMNPCKCGYYPDMQKCRCTDNMIHQYLNRISQPLLDRIDICVETPQLRYEELIGAGKEKSETSIQIRERVVRTHEIQIKRFEGTKIRFNSQIPAALISEICPLNRKQEEYMKDIYRKLNLSARAYHKILKVARTIADIDESEKITMTHLNEAICYRSIDKKFWER